MGAQEDLDLALDLLLLDGLQDLDDDLLVGGQVVAREDLTALYQFHISIIYIYIYIYVYVYS